MLSAIRSDLPDADIQTIFQAHKEWGEERCKHVAIRLFPTSKFIRYLNIHFRMSYLIYLIYPDDRLGFFFCRGTERYRNDHQHNRLIKVGYVSPDFFTHSVSYFIEGILSQHDRSKFVVYW